DDSINDPGYFWLGNHKFRDDKPGGHGVVDMYKSIVQSCDTYYYVLAHDLGVDAIHDFMAPIGFGQLTGIDMRGELRGTLPSTAWKHESFRTREQRRWYAGETISLGIGQGYNSFTMLQLAQATATLAEGGRRFRPHLVKSIESADAGGARRLVGEALPPLPWRAEDVAVIRRAMYGVTQEGPSRAVFAGAPYASGGKTGTAQVIRIGKNEKYDASELAEHHRDHALYTAFAPLDAPRIALALVVENAGFGAAAAAPIARRVLDYVMLGLYPSEADIAATQQGKSTVPIGTPRPAASVPLPGVTIDLSSMAGIEPTPVGAADPVGSDAPVAAPAPDATTPAPPTVAARQRAPRAPVTTPRQHVALRSDPSTNTP
ncbi:MAG TPA: penicillin-binding transpeptidase domain-containing protein, partial [Burkholderiaceae bacterium]|nr:penicillin-binding transpeptidase domain-containing protein [Burkholderiaceae bacterium]